MRILLAEDRVSLQRAIQLLAEDWRIHLDVVSDGQQAVAQVRKHHYDLCILDMRMPVMSGAEAARIIRRERYVPILALTADSPREHPGIFEYVDDYLEKPFDIEVLHRKIQELTLKPLVIRKQKNHIHFYKEMPMDSDYLNKLRELDKQGLTILTIREKPAQYFVHKRVQNKISHAFFGKGQEVVQFLDHAQDRPGLCHLYKYNLHSSVWALLPEEYEQLCKSEKEEMENYETPFWGKDEGSRK